MAICKICRKPALIGFPNYVCYDCKYHGITTLDMFGEEE